MAVVIEASGQQETRLWSVTAEICALFADLEWALIGGQMVAILEAEHGRPVGRTTVDVDALIDVGGVMGSPRVAAGRLLAEGFEPQATGEIVYRFVRGADTVDILAPDNFGPRARLETVPPGVTVGMAGGRQALRRRRQLRISVSGKDFEVPVPTVAGAMVIKARSAHAPGRAERDLHDLARLLALVPDPEAIRSQLTSRERGYLRAHASLLDLANPSWIGVANAEDGVIALERITGG